MSKNKEVTGHIQWSRMLKKLNPYTIRKGLRYFKHYGPKEFWIRLHERFEPEAVPYGPWYEAYIPDDTELEKQRKYKFSYSPLISVAGISYTGSFSAPDDRFAAGTDIQQLGTLHCKRKPGR